MLCGVILGLLKYFISVVLFCVPVNTYLVCFDLILILVHCKFVLSCRVRKTARSDRYAIFFFDSQCVEDIFATKSTVIYCLAPVCPCIYPFFLLYCIQGHFRYRGHQSCKPYWPRLKKISGLGGDGRSGGGESGAWLKQRYTFLSTFPHLSLCWNDRYKDHRDGQLTSPSSDQISGQGLWLAALNFLKTFFPFRLWLFVGEGSESYKTGLTTLPSFADPSIRKRRSSALQLFSFWDFFKNFSEIFILCKILTIYDDRVMSVQNISRIGNADEYFKDNSKTIKNMGQSINL